MDAGGSAVAARYAQMTLKTFCLDCGVLCTGSRCRPCHRKRRNAGYDSREYRALGRPSGPCQMCILCTGAPATTWEHRIPLSRGGTHARSNIIPACGRCNSSKRDR